MTAMRLTFFEFSGGEKTLVEILEVAVVDDGHHGGHVERGARNGTAAGDVAAAVELAAVTVKGGQAEEVRGLAAGQGAEFRDMREQGRRDHRPHAFDLLEALRFGRLGGLVADPGAAIH